MRLKGYLLYFASIQELDIFDILYFFYCPSCKTLLIKASMWVVLFMWATPDESQTQVAGMEFWNVTNQTSMTLLILYVLRRKLLWVDNKI